MSSKIYITTDTHFGHKKLIELGRPENFEALITAQLLTLKRDDILIHLGDISVGDDKLNHAMFFELFHYIRRLILVRGNHDQQSNFWYFDHGWDMVCDSFKLNFEGKVLLFSHRPEPKQVGVDYNIHGHTHGNGHREAEYGGFYEPGYHVELALENNGYKPFELREILQKCAK